MLAGGSRQGIGRASLAEHWWEASPALHVGVGRAMESGLKGGQGDRGRGSWWRTNFSSWIQSRKISGSRAKWWQSLIDLWWCKRMSLMIEQDAKWDKTHQKLKTTRRASAASRQNVHCVGVESEISSHLKAITKQRQFGPNYEAGPEDKKNTRAKCNSKATSKPISVQDWNWGEGRSHPVSPPEG